MGPPPWEVLDIHHSSLSRSFIWDSPILLDELKWGQDLGTRIKPFSVHS